MAYDVKFMGYKLPVGKLPVPYIISKGCNVACPRYRTVAKHRT